MTGFWHHTAMREPEEQPQWVKSRLKAVSKLKDCGSTHGACKCFVKRVVDLEAELASLREQLRAATGETDTG